MDLGGLLENVGTQNAQKLFARRGYVVKPLPLAHRGLLDMTETGDGGGSTESADDLSNVHGPIIGDPNSEGNRSSEDNSEYAIGMLKDRLRLAMEGPPPVKQSALADACGISPVSVNDWLSGKSKSLRGKNLMAAANFLHVNPLWLASGRGPMRPAGFSQQDREKLSKPEPVASQFGRPDPAILVSAGVILDLLETAEGRATLLPPDALPVWLRKLAAMYDTVEAAGGEISLPQLQEMMRAAIRRRDAAGGSDDARRDAGSTGHGAE